MLHSFGPEALVDPRSFFFNEGTGNLDRPLAAGEDFAAG
jgi:hypothetical protein